MSSETTPSNAADRGDAPEQVGPYRIETRLGRGGMGEVYRGWDDRLQRSVALKRVHPERTDVEAARMRFRREAQAVARIQHPAVVQVHDWVEHESGDWFVMELVQGQPLRDLLAAGPLSWQRVLDIGREVASALAAAHERGLVHRDLKLDNVMLSQSGQVKVLDFGLVKEVTASASSWHEVSTLVPTLTQHGQILGTVSTMAPEQAMGGEIDPRTDLFALGVLLYELVTGGPPFTGPDALTVLNRVCVQQQVPAHEVVATVPEDLSRLIDALLEKEPARRPESTGVVLAELQRLRASGAEGAGERALPVAGVEEPAKPVVSWHRKLGWGALLVSLAVISTLAYSVFLAGEGTPGATSGRRSAVAAAPTEDGSVDDLYRHGMALLDAYDAEGHVEAAVETFQRLLDREPDSAPGHAGLALAYWHLSVGSSQDPVWVEQARTMAERAVHLDPFLAAGHLALGRVYGRLGRFKNATEELQQAARLEPGSARVQVALGKLAQLQQQFPAASVAYEHALELQPTHREALAALGMLSQQTGDLGQAANYFQRLIEVAPDGVTGYRNLSAIYYLQGQLGAAADTLQRALEVEPRASLYSNLGTLFFAQGLYPQAADAFAQALELPGGSHSYRIWGNLGDAYRWIPDHEVDAQAAYLRAIQLASRTLAARPDALAVRSRLALYRAKRGDCAGAEAELERLPESAVASVYFRRAVVRELCADRVAALAQLAAALSGGYPLTDVERDPELLKLRADVRFHHLMMEFTALPAPAS